MDTSDRAGEAVRPAIQHPDAAIPPGMLDAAYVALLSAFARYEPDALQRVARALDDEGTNLPGERSAGTAGRLARSWLTFMGPGRHEDVSAPERVFSFAFPATMSFEMVGTGDAKSARRRALRALHALIAEDVPLGAVSGPHPANLAILNLVVWAGSAEGDADDRLHLELATNDENEED